jgi:hypothetical protein
LRDSMSSGRRSTAFRIGRFVDIMVRV